MEPLHIYDVVTENNPSLNIRLWCISKNNEIRLLKINGFKTWCYVEFPKFKKWKKSEIKDILNQISTNSKTSYIDFEMVKKSKLFYLQKEKDSFEFAKVYFDNTESMTAFSNWIEVRARPNILKKSLSKFPTKDKKQIKSEGQIIFNPDLKYKKRGYKFDGYEHMVLRCWEGEGNKGKERIVTSVRRLLSIVKIPHAGWFTTSELEINIPEYFIGLKQEEYLQKRIKPVELSLSSSPTLLVFDIECYSDNHNMFPDAEKVKCPVYMISCIFQRLGDVKSRQRILLHTKETKIKEEIVQFPDLIIDTSETEKELIDTFCDVIIDLDPDIISGYNIHGFDFDYINTRLKTLAKKDLQPCYNFKKECSRYKYSNPEFRKRSWKSSAYGNVSISKVFMEGRISIDLMDFVKKNFKLAVYSLNAVSKEFLKSEKFDVSAKDMFEAYLDCLNDKEGCVDRMTEVAAYAVQDSELVVDLFEKLNVWKNLVEFSSAGEVSITEIIESGQQIRIAANLYDIIQNENMVIDTREFKSVYFESDEARKKMVDKNPVLVKSAGAFVCQPDRGRHENVICLDVSSMYPSIMRSKNLSYSTLLVKSTIFEEIAFSGFGKKVDDQTGLDQMYVADPFKYEDKRYVLEIENEDNFHFLEFVNKLKKFDYSRPHGQEEIEEENSSDYSEDESESESEGEGEGGAVKKKKSTTRSMIKRSKYALVFAKENVRKGELPRLVEKMLNKRKEVRLIKESIDKKIKKGEGTKDDELLSDLLEQKQLAIKVVANSCYGFVGTHRTGGKIPVVEVAMSITAMGRDLIKRTNDYIIKTYEGKIVYGDTDSTMFKLPKQIKTSQDCLAWGERLAQEVNEKVCSQYVKFEMEKGMNVVFLDKKMYYSRFITEKGYSDLKYKGVVLTKRDRPEIVKKIYREIAELTVDNPPEECWKKAYSILFEGLKYILTEDENKLALQLAKVRKMGSNYKKPGIALNIFSHESARIGKPIRPGERIYSIIVDSYRKGIEKDIPFYEKMGMIELNAKGQLPKLKVGYAMRQLDHWLTQKQEDRENIDRFYYINSDMQKPFDVMFSTLFGKFDYLDKVTTIAPGCRSMYTLKTPINYILALFRYCDDLKLTKIELIDQIEELIDSEDTFNIRKVKGKIIMD